MKLLDVTYVIFERKESGNPNKLQYFFDEALTKLSEIDSENFIAAINDELKSTSSEVTIRTNIKIFANHWLKFPESTRMRIENKLIKSVESGSIRLTDYRLLTGGLGTWAIHIIDKMMLFENLHKALLENLKNSDKAIRYYVLDNFGKVLFMNQDLISDTLISIVKSGLKEGDERFYELVDSEKDFFKENWTSKVKEEFSNFQKKE